MKEIDKQDFSNRKLLALERISRSILQGFWYGLYVVDAEWMITDWQVSSEHFPLRSEIIGKGLFECFPLLKEKGLKELISQVFKTGEPLLISDFHLQRLYKDNRSKVNINIYPLRDENSQVTKIIIAVESSEEKQFRSDIELRQISHLETSIAELNSSLELATALQTIAESYAHLQGSVKCLIRLFDGNRRRLYNVASVGLSLNYLERRGIIELGETPSGLAAAERREIVVEDIQIDPDFADLRYAGRREGFRSIWSFPLLGSDDRLLGTIDTFYPYPHRPSEEELWVAKLYANQAALAIENARLHQRLRRLYESNQSSLEHAPFGVLEIDRSGRVTYLNQAQAELMGDSVEAIINKNILSLPDFHLAGFADLCREGFRLKKGEVIERINVEYTASSGKRAIISLSATPIYEGEEFKALLIFIKDVTDKVNLEKQLRQAEELASLGELAASIAHEVRNPLTGVRTTIQFLGETFEEDDPRKEDIEDVIGELDRLEELIRQLLAFARPPDLHLIKTDLASLLEQVVETFRRQLAREDIEIDLEITPSLGEIEVDPEVMKQVFLNLFLNAEQAMPQGGEIEIKAHPRYVDGAMREILIDVIDTGSGIAKEKLDKIFQPFFTTKSKGTGFGLSISQRLVEKHGGKLSAENRRDRSGMIFTISLPLREEGLR